MEYYKWMRKPFNVSDLPYRDFMLIGKFHLIEPNVDEDVLHEQIQIKKWDVKNWAEYIKSGPRLDCIEDVRDLKLVSDRARDIIMRECADDVRFFPLKLKDRLKKNPINGYNLLVCNHHLDCIDLENTPHEIDPDMPELVSRLRWDRDYVLKRSEIGDQKIFKLKRHWTTTIVREDLRDVIRFNELSGFGFKKLECT